MALVQVFDFKVELLGIRPVIWRKFAMRADLSLGHLHTAIQGAMGWFDAHLHVFIIDGKLYSPPDEDAEEDNVVPMHRKFHDENKTVLGRLLMLHDKFKYEYDMGDSWMHELTVTKVESMNINNKRWAWLLDGDNACPPEDVGGIEGFRQMVKTLKTKPDSPQAKEYIDWLGYKYNPEIFNMAEAYKFMMDSMKRNYS